MQPPKLRLPAIQGGNVAAKEDLLDSLTSTPGGGSTDKLEDKGVRKKLEAYWGNAAIGAADESVERMKTRNEAIRFSKGLPPRGEKPKEEVFKPVPGHPGVSAGGRCEKKGCRNLGEFLCFQKRRILCKICVEGHRNLPCGRKEQGDGVD